MKNISETVGKDEKFLGKISLTGITEDGWQYMGISGSGKYLIYHRGNQSLLYTIRTGEAKIKKRN
jgi:hypothetical protein